MTVALADLRAAISKEKLDTIPAGWMSATGWAQQWRVSTQHAQRMLEEAVAAGKAERAVYRIPSGGTPRKVRHYKITLP